MKKHDLKTWPAGFQDIVDDKKTNEYREDDGRDFRVGDILHLKEYVPKDLASMMLAEGYTGRECMVKVTHITYCGDWDGTKGHVVMSFKEKFVWGVRKGNLHG